VTTGAAVRRLLSIAHDQYRKPEFQVRFSWRPGSVAFWDNRAAVHYAVRNYVDFPRLLERILIAKVLGYLRCARAAAPYMIGQGWGRIVNISGLAARSVSTPSGSIRNVAVAALTKSLADELGPAGINVTVVHPGLTATERTPAMIARFAAARGSTEDEAEARLGAGSSIGRIVTAAEVADVVAFLASPRSVAINGDAIAAGGGTPGAIHY
jgi:NAD(P)-dependent dehydrogenase (short-subunit alcohol dehydrogenase family)